MLIHDTRHAVFSPYYMTAIFDLDGVMINNRERVNLHLYREIDGERQLVGNRMTRADWDAYEADEHLDTPTAMVEVVNQMHLAFNILVCTARPVHTHESTVNRLTKIGLSAERYQIHMRDDMAQSAHEYKRQVVRTLRAEGHRIAMAVDDEARVTQAYVEEGVIALRMYNLLDPQQSSYHY
jgi:hypothetical protein